MSSLRTFVASLLIAAQFAQPLRADELPDLGDVSSSELSLSAEKRMGQQIMQDIRWREPAYLDDPDVESYLNQLGARLTAVSADPGFGFYFFPINDASINAFAMPGGYIGVHSGLIMTAQSESELAGVLAHEISHVTQRHIARQLYQSRNIGMATIAAMVVALLAARSNGQVATAAIAGTQAGVLSSQLAFSRDFEREADRLGFDVLRKSGFDVRGMAGFFQRLQKASRLYENSATAYLRTHPLTNERLTDMQNRDMALPYHQVPDSLEFHLVRAKLRALQGTPGEAIADLETLLKEKKFANETAIRYGLAYARFRNRDWRAAEGELDSLRRGKVHAAMIEHLRADIRIARDDVDGGLATYREAMQRYPQDLGLVYGYGAALAAAHRYQEARSFAESQLKLYSEDIRLFKLRAEAHAGLGQRAQQHQALSEVFALQGQLPVAIDQLQMALKAGDASFYELSAIDARLAEFKQRLREEQKDKWN